MSLAALRIASARALAPTFISWFRPLLSFHRIHHTVEIRVFLNMETLPEGREELFILSFVPLLTLGLG